MQLRQLKKAIWDIQDEHGTKLSSQWEIKMEAISYFSKLFTKPQVNNLEAQFKILSIMPRLFSEEDIAIIGSPITLSEIEDILKNMDKGRSPGPDGWSSEFFIQFFEFLGPELVKLVEVARCGGKVSRGVNATFLALIPKSTNVESFHAYRPISLCNLIYKVI